MPITFTSTVTGGDVAPTFGAARSVTYVKVFGFAAALPKPGSNTTLVLDSVAGTAVICAPLAPAAVVL